MRFLFFFITILFGLLSYSQEKSYTKAQLDSMSKESTFLEKEAYSLNLKDTTNFDIVERVPVYKGCEKEIGNMKKKECMSQKITAFFKKNFNTTLPKDSKVPSGKIRIFVKFYIDIDGSVVDAIANGPNQYLENEALRVIHLVPKFSPGLFKGKAIKVPYSLPLTAVVDNKSDINTNTTYPIYRGCDKSSSNEELKKCSVEKIKNFIKMSFDTGIADVALPLEKSTQFQLDFVINKKGKIEQVNAKANHRAIAIEAIKVAKRLPKFKKPGTVNGEAVDTPFSLLMTIYF
jgi:ribosome-associated translation inhibitor RaiA